MPDFWQVFVRMGFLAAGFWPPDFCLRGFLVLEKILWRNFTTHKNFFWRVLVLKNFFFGCLCSQKNYF
jgi:hypothetical protein